MKYTIEQLEKMKYIDLVLVENIVSREKTLAIAKAHEVSTGDMVRLDDNTIGNVLATTWIGDPKDEVLVLLQLYCPIDVIKEVYRRKALE